MAATERPPLRGASVDTRVLAVRGRRRAGAPRPPGRRGAARDPRCRAAARRPVRVAVTMRTPGQRLRARRGLPALGGAPAVAARALRDQVLHRRRARRAGLQRRHGAPAPAVRGRSRAAQLRRDVGLRRLRQGLDRLRSRSPPSRWARARRPGRGHRRAARAPARRAAHVRAHRRPARDRACSRPTAS